MEVRTPMRIGILGYESNNSWTPLMAKALNDEKHLIVQFSVNEVKSKLSPVEMDDYLKYKKLYPLSMAIKGHEDKFDILIVEQSFLYFYNDLTIPVLYYHTELNTPPTVGNSDGGGAPTHLAMKLPEIANWFRSIYRYWYERAVKYHFYLFPHAYPPHYMPDTKKKHDISYIGIPSDMFDRTRDWVWNRMTLNMNRIINYIVSHELCTIYNNVGEKPCHQIKYNELLHESAHVVLLAHDGVYIGRSAFEALACKTIPILWIENDDAEKFIRSLGFEPKGPKQNCYFFRDEYELENLCKNLQYDQAIADRGYELLLNHHTPGHRALTILKVLELTLDVYRVKPDAEPKVPRIAKAEVMVK